MKNLVRGGVLAALAMLLVVFIYAESEPQLALAIATDSQADTIQNNLVINNLSTDSNTAGTDIDLADASINDMTQTQDQEKDGNTLIVKTGSVRSAAGASKGAFSATAYCLKGKTAMGHGVRRGLIAADPRVLKLGSRVVISAGAWSGTYLVSDTGSGVKGREIDIWVPSCSEARKFGRRTVQIYSAQ